MRPRDGWDTIDWIAAQPWCDGNIGMAGESYHGLTQWAVAGAGHPNLRCVAPGDTAPDLYRAAYPGGAFALMTMGEWAYEMNARDGCATRFASTPGTCLSLTPTRPRVLAAVPSRSS